MNIDHSRQVHILPRGHIDPSRGTQPLIDPSSRIQQSHHDPSRGLDHRAHLMDQGRGQGHGHGQGLLDHEVHQHDHELGVNMRQDQDKVKQDWELQRRCEINLMRLTLNDPLLKRTMSDSRFIPLSYQ